MNDFYKINRVQITIQAQNISLIYAVLYRNIINQNYI